MTPRPPHSRSELYIFCDESAEKGRHFSNFYGGIAIDGRDYAAVAAQLDQVKQAQNLFKEVKWTKVTETYLPKYIALVDAFFDLVEAGKIKIRIMFTQNTRRATGLSQDHINNKYFILYYQFVKHAFGLAHNDIANRPINVRVYFDKMPDKDEKVVQFRAYIASMAEQSRFRRAGITIKNDDIAEVDSDDHSPLQCLDIVLGAMWFRLNDQHLEKISGTRVRGKRTRAKEKLYKHINKRIRKIRPGFNIGVTTSDDGNPENRWQQPYRHWVFTPSNHEVLPGSKTQLKSAKRKK